MTKRKARRKEGRIEGRRKETKEGRKLLPVHFPFFERRSSPEAYMGEPLTRGRDEGDKGSI